MGLLAKNNILVNLAQRRLRTFWRVLLHAMLAFLLAGFALSVVLFSIAIASGMAGMRQQDVALAEYIYLQLQQAAWMGMLAEIISLGAVMLATWLAARFLDRRKFAAFGLVLNKRWWRDLIFGLSLAAGLLLVIFLLSLWLGWVQVSGFFQPTDGGHFTWGFLQALVVYICLGIKEELLFRGYQRVNLLEGVRLPFLPKPVSIMFAGLLTAISYAAVHLLNPQASLLNTFALILTGLVLFLAVALTGSLAVSIGFNIGWHFFQSAVFGFSFNATKPVNAIMRITTRAPAWLLGDAHGVQNGLVGFLALLLGCGAIIFWVWRTRGQVRLYEPPVEQINTRKP